MFGLLILLLILFLLWPLIKVLWRTYVQVNRMRRFMADPAGEMRRQAEKAARNRSKTSSATPSAPRKEKKIPRDVGEYISYTEIEVSEEQRRADGQRQSVSYTEEEQITDIKWVDIK